MLYSSNQTRTTEVSTLQLSLLQVIASAFGLKRKLVGPVIFPKNIETGGFKMDQQKFSFKICAIKLPCKEDNICE